MRQSTLTFDLVPDDVAEEEKKHTGRREWAQLLMDGKMLRMNRRPQWTKSDKSQSGMRLRTKAVNDGTDDVYVWLEQDESVTQPDTTEHELHSVLAG